VYEGGHEDKVEILAKGGRALRTNRRVLIATSLGLVFGVLNWLVGISTTAKPLPRSFIAAIILGRAVLGFVIGISCWKIRWWWHGVLLGFIVSLPAAFAMRLMSTPFTTSPDVSTVLGLVVGMVIGFLIELFTSVVFKAKSAQRYKLPSNLITPAASASTTCS
jgi:hypothetical protein